MKFLTKNQLTLVMLMNKMTYIPGLNNNGKVIVSISLIPSLKNKIDKISKKYNISKSELIEDLIESIKE